MQTGGLTDWTDLVSDANEREWLAALEREWPVVCLSVQTTSRNPYESRVFAYIRKDGAAVWLLLVLLLSSASLTRSPPSIQSV